MSNTETKRVNETNARIEEKAREHYKELLLEALAVLEEYEEAYSYNDLAYQVESIRGRIQKMIAEEEGKP